MIKCPKWDQQDNLRCEFPVLLQIPGVETERIHQLQQKKVFRICEILRDDERVLTVVLFGSSVNLRCNQYSDIDVAVRLREEFVCNEVKNDVSEKIQLACDWNADILWYDRIQNNSRFLENVLKGVQII